MNEELPDYRAMLEMEFETRRAKNPRYSQRRFASLLNISPSYLSMLLRGERRLTIRSGLAMSRKLKWPSDKRKQFEILIRLESADDDERSDLIGELAELSSLSNATSVSVEKFALVSKWYHLAITALVGVEGFRPDPHEIARRLNIHPMEAELALNRLLTMGILESREGKISKSSQLFSTGDVPSAAIRRYHKTMLGKGIDALEQQTMDERDISGVTMAVNPEQIPKAKREIAKFRRRLRQLLAEGRKTEVYHLETSFFRLDSRHGESEKGKVTDA